MKKEVQTKATAGCGVVRVKTGSGGGSSSTRSP